MGGKPKKPIVAVNEKGEAASYYESVSQAAMVNGVFRRGITESLKTGAPYKGFKWMLESAYRELWFKGKTASLAFSCSRMRSDIALRRWRNMSDEKKKERSVKLSKARKKLISQRPEVMEPSRRVHRQPVLCVNTGECFPSIADLAKAYGLNPSSARTASYRGMKVKGYIIKRISKEEYDNKTADKGNNRKMPA